MQAFLFCLVGNYMLGVPDRFWPIFFMIFSVFCSANLIGLILSSSFNSPVTIYVIIPLVIIPQMLLGGAMFRFSKINNLLGSSSYEVPLLSNFMVSRWAYEGIMVDLFKNNAYEKQLFIYDKAESKLNYKLSYLIPKINELKDDIKTNEKSLSKKQFSFLNKIISNSLRLEYIIAKNEYNFQQQVSKGDSLKDLGSFYTNKFNYILEMKDSVNQSLKVKDMDIENTYTNRYLLDLTTNSFEKDKILVDSVNYKFIQIIDPIFKDPEDNKLVSLNAHFYSPYKYLFNQKLSTYAFNIIVIWCINIIFFLILYVDGIKVFLKLFDK